MWITVIIIEKKKIKTKFILQHIHDGGKISAYYPQNVLIYIYIKHTLTLNTITILTLLLTLTLTLNLTPTLNQTLILNLTLIPTLKLTLEGNRQIFSLFSNLIKILLFYYL